MSKNHIFAGQNRPKSRAHSDLTDMTKEEIIGKLKDNHNRLIELVDSLNEYDFGASPMGKWTAGQQLDHIYRSLKPLANALVLPKISIKALIGTAREPSMDYAALVAKYHAALDAGG